MKRFFLYDRISKTDLISGIVVLVGTFFQFFLYITKYIEYYYISSIIVGLGFSIFGINHLFEKNTDTNQNKRIVRNKLGLNKFFIFFSISSIIVGLSMILGDSFTSFGYIRDIYYLVIIGRLFRTLYLCILLMICMLLIFLTYIYKKRFEIQLIPLISEIIFVVILILMLYMDIESMFYYQCYRLFELPSCFPSGFYFLTSSLYVILSGLFVKLVQIFSKEISPIKTSVQDENENLSEAQVPKQNEGK